MTENPKNIAANTIVINDNRIDISLPYFVYITKTVNAANPMKRKIQARTHNVSEGIAGISYRFEVL